MKETKERAPYHMTLVNNETGEVINDYDIYAIVGATALEGDRTNSLGLTNCNGSQLVHTILGAQEAIEALFDTHPGLELMCNFIKSEKANK